MAILFENILPIDNQLLAFVEIYFVIFLKYSLDILKNVHFLCCKYSLLDCLKLYRIDKLNSERNMLNIFMQEVELTSSLPIHLLHLSTF